MNALAGGAARLLGALTFVAIAINEGATSLVVMLVVIAAPSMLLSEPRLWPRVLWGAPVCALNSFVTSGPLMLFAVANLDSAAWGTRAAALVESEALMGGADAAGVRVILAAIARFAASPASRSSRGGAASAPASCGGADVERDGGTGTGS